MPPGAAAPAACIDDPGATVCTCMSVTQGEITSAIGAGSLRTVEQVGEHTRAGTGCGTCRVEIGALLDIQHAVAEAASEPAVRPPLDERRAPGAGNRSGHDQKEQR